MRPEKKNESKMSRRNGRGMTLVAVLYHETTGHAPLISYCAEKTSSATRWV